MATPRDQPSKVATEDVIKPDDNHVTTSDTPAEVTASRDPDPGKKKAAASDDESGSSNDQKSAPGDDKKYSRKQIKRGDRRFDKLTLRLDQADKQNQALSKRVEEVETENAALKAATPAKPEPKLDDFKNPQEYAKAYSKWEKDNDPASPGKNPASSASSPPPPPPPPPPAPSANESDIEQFRQLGTKVIGDDFVKALQDKDNAVNATMGEFMIGSDAGPEIYVHLSKNKEEARKIFDMKDSDKATAALEKLEAQAVEGKLGVPEGQLDVAENKDPDEEKPKPKAKRPGGTNAPEPASDTKPGNTTPTKDPDEMDMDEYKAYRDNQERKRMGLPPI